MMSEFKFCPMCGVERIDGEQFCHNCDFEYLFGSYVKSEANTHCAINSTGDNQDIIKSEKKISNGDNPDILKSEEKISNGDNQDIIKSEEKISEKKIDVQLVSQEEFADANDLIKSMSAEINESIDKCLNKLAFDLENDSDLKKSNSDFDASILSSENLDISTINGDVEFSDLIEDIDYSNEDLLNAQNTFSNWIVYNQSHLPGFIINKYKEPVIANINRLTRIIGSLESIENYDGLDRLLDILNDYLNNQESFLNNF